MKLKTKIQLFSSLFMVVLILLVNTSIYVLFYNTTADTELNQLTTQTNDLMNRLNEHTNADVSGLVEAYLPSDGMIRVIDENGDPLIEQMRSADYRTLPWQFSNQESHEIISQHKGPDTAVITKPMIWNSGENAGEIVTLQVSNQLIALQEQMTTLFYVLVVASIIMLIPIVVAGNLLGKFILKPIKTLIEAMKNNTRHDKWQKIDVKNRSRDELYEMEATFNEMIDYLRDNFEKQEAFVSNASHELKTPIQIIKSYAQLLERRGPDRPELLPESVATIDTEADRMKKLVEQMLALAKNKQTIKKEPVDLVSLAEETAATFQGAYEREIGFEENAERLIINGNRDQLEQVFYILIDNAIKYSEEKIAIRTMKRNGAAVFQVEDYGRGMTKENQERIFDRFYRVDKARSRDTGGTGLGLAIANTIAEEHNGKLSVESTEGNGSEFTLRIPISDSLSE